MPFDPVDPKQSFPDLELGMLKYWREEDTFKRSMSRRKDGEVFSFYDGPPFATGLPHYGHILAGTIKDVIPRYQTMRGKYVKRRFGWDCHGLPVENEIEKEQKLLSKKDIETLGVANFNALCRSAVQRYTKEWRNTVERMGRWVDMDHDYRTMDPDYMESIWWVFKQLHTQGLIYEGFKPMHVCPRCQTALSNFEVTQGYKDIQDYSVTAMFELSSSLPPSPSPKGRGGTEETSIEFRAPKNQPEWDEIHRIRKEEIFSVYHPNIAYDPAFATDGKTPDDTKKGNYLFVLLLEGNVIGTMRIDMLSKNEAALRLIAIDHRYQKKGLGDVLMDHAEAFIREKGCSVILLHAEKPIVPFYTKRGYVQTTDWKEKGMGFMDMKKNLEHLPSPPGRGAGGEGKTYALAWTTTGWTLPGNLFLAVQPDVTYATVSCENNHFIVAKDLAVSVFKGKEFQIIAEQKGKDLIGKKYKPLFPYFAEKYADTAFRIVAGDFVTTEDGTGVVHIATGYGDDDFQVGQREKVGVLQHVGIEGIFTKEVTDFAGKHAKPKDDHQSGDKMIAEWLKKHGKLLKAETFMHSYPHCWRCDSPLLNYATSSWFVAVEKIKPLMIESNAKTAWVPSHLRDGRFGKWLEGARDWAISRNRYWGTPLPIWKNNVTGEVEVIGSRDELVSKAPERFTKIVMARHAESEGNVDKVYQGKEPGTKLTENGKKQAKDLAIAVTGIIQSLPLKTIYCSPLQRTRETAEAIAAQTGATIVIDDRLREIEFGDYEGKHIDFDDLTFIRERRAHKLETEQVESIYHFQGMETWSSVERRLGTFFDEILKKHKGETVTVVTHADLIMNGIHFFTGQDKHKIVHQPYPDLAAHRVFYWDHEKGAQLDLHKETVDDILWHVEAKKTKSKSKAKTDVAAGTVELTLVRHGETDANKEKIEQGSDIDMPLNKTGKLQAKKAGESLKGQTFDVVISSHMKRASETAKIMAAEIGADYAGGFEIFRERGMGEWAGKATEEIMATHGKNQPSKKPSFIKKTPKGGESFEEFVQRTQKAHDWLLKEYAGKKVLLVAHGAFNRAFLMTAEGLPYAQACTMEPKNTHIDLLTLRPQLRRIGDVLDCWFESGSMPYAQEHFPFEGKKEIPPGFPADFIAEGLDQTRGWFYTLTVLSSALFHCPAFRHCVVNGIVLAEDGKKMSKRLKNYPEPTVVAERHGADAVRFALMSSPAVRGEDLRFSEKLIEETVRSVLLPLWNAYRLFVTYSNAAGWKPSLDFSLKNAQSKNLLDRWIVLKTQTLVNNMTTELDGYDLSATCAHLTSSIDDLTNWYVRLSRRRLAGKESGETASESEHIDALDTLYRVLLANAQLLAPFCPFISEAIYLNLVAEDHGSVHFTDWPSSVEINAEDKALLTRMDNTRSVVTLGLKLRADAKIRVRTPLQSVTVALPPNEAGQMVKELIAEELNVKQVIDVVDAASIAERILMIDARKVGPRLGSKVQELIRAGKEGKFEEKDGVIVVMGETLTSEEASLSYRSKEGKNVAAERGIVVSIDATMSPALTLEGQARELIHAIQVLRKDAGLEFTDKIKLQLSGADAILAAHQELVLGETKAQIAETKTEMHAIEIDDLRVSVRFEKA